MFFNSKSIILLPFLYFSLTLCFHKNIHTSSNILCLNKQLSLYTSNLPEIPTTEPLPEIPTTEPLPEIPTTEPLPDILLPYLSPLNKLTLAAGGIVEKQDRNGDNGSGLIVIDIKSSPDVVFDTLAQFAMYQDMIPVVRSSKIISSNDIDTVTEFILSNLSLYINVKHTVLKEQRLIKFTLDPNRKNIVLKKAEGFWYVETPSDRPEGYCRVYLSAQIVSHKNIPKVIIDYAATKALSKATKWIKPFFIEKERMK